MLTDSRSEESSPKSEPCSVLGRYPIPNQVFKVEVSTMQREKHEIKGKAGFYRVFQLGVGVGMDRYRKDYRRRGSMIARKIREGGILVAQERRKRRFDSLFISGMKNKE